MIIISRRDLPPGVSPEIAAALVLGQERAARDLLVVVDTVDGPIAAPQTQPTQVEATDYESVDVLRLKPLPAGLAGVKVGR